MRYSKRILAFGAILVLMASLVVPWAPSPHVQAGPSDPDYGQLWNPIEIDTCEELQAMDTNVSGSYLLISDIDCSGTDFQPVGLSDTFIGTLNGQGHAVSNLDVPLFGTINQAIISNLYLYSNQIADAGSTGILAGIMDQSLVANVRVEGSLVLDQGFTYMGGLVGASYSSTIQQSSAVVSVEVAGGQTIYGGLAGNTAYSRILNSYAVTTLSGAGSLEHIGGLISNDNTSTIENSYAAGSFSGVSIHEAGGLVWRGDSTVVTNSFSTVEDSGICGPGSCSGLVTVGSGTPDLSTDYFDQTAAGTSDCSAIVGVTCHAVNTDGSEPNYFYNNSTNPPLAEWDFTTIWTTTLGLPVLRPITSSTVDPVGDLTANIGSTTSIDLAWSMPVDTGSAPLLGEVVYYQKAGETTWTQEQTFEFNPGGAPGTNFEGTSLLVSNLSPGSQYSFKVVFYNQLGEYSVASVQGVTATPGTAVINSCQDLQDIDADLTANYEVGRNIDCSDTINWNGGLGFSPIGCSSSDEYFIGTLQGNNYTISDLYIAQSCTYRALFSMTVQALIQDVTFTNPVLVGPVDGNYKSVVSGLDYMSTFNNVHITGNFVGDQSVHSGIIGASYGGSKINQSSFTGSIATTSDQHIFGGFIAAVANYLGQPTTITNSYVQADITVTPADPEQDSENLIGGLVGEYGGLAFRVTNSYAALTLTQPDVMRPLRLGGLVSNWSLSEGNTPTSFATNSFASTQVDLNPAADNNVGGLAGIIPDYGSGGVVNLAGNYFDADAIGTTLCAGESNDPVNNPFLPATCNVISGQPGYFLNNSTNPPMNSWDFTNIWQTTSTFPVFAENRPINPIPPERLQPKKKDDPKPVVVNTGSSGTGTPGAAASTDAAGNDSADGGVVPVGGGFIERLKELFDRIPAAVLKGFPYLLFALLLLAALALLIEMIRQTNRLRELNILLAEQRAVAEKRDTFWHLAANYLRAPITLLMGGADLLVLGKAGTAETDKVTAMSKRLQTKVTDIMNKIEKSHSLQDIHAPVDQETRRVWLSAGFLIPVGVVAVLIGVTNYLAREWRDLHLSTVTLAIQALIFLLVAVALYWALGAFGTASRKRRDAEVLLAEQEQALDHARMKLMRETASELDADVSHLQLSLNKLPNGSEAKPIMQEGATRLRHLIDSFALLISAQNHKLGGLSPAGASAHLGKVLQGCLADLQPEITAKNLTIEAPAKLNLKVVGSTDLNTQLLGSILANAISFSPTGGTINIATQQAEDGSVELSLTDHGSGIAPSEEAHIFQPFTKADGQAALQLDHEGLGINLYLDRQLMDYLGGEIMVHSISGTGTTVKLQWPGSLAQQNHANMAAVTGGMAS